MGSIDEMRRAAHVYRRASSIRQTSLHVSSVDVGILDLLWFNFEQKRAVFQGNSRHVAVLLKFYEILLQTNHSTWVDRMSAWHYSIWVEGMSTLLLLVAAAALALASVFSSFM